MGISYPLHDPEELNSELIEAKTELLRAQEDIEAKSKAEYEEIVRSHMINQEERAEQEKMLAEIEEKLVLLKTEDFSLSELCVVLLTPTTTTNNETS